MISYIEKGAGLHTAISSAGHWLAHVDGVWVSSDDEAVQAIIDGYSLAQAQADVCAKIALYAKGLRDKVVADLSPAEMSAWPLKLAEANTYAGDDAAVPMLSIEAAARNCSVPDLVVKVKSKAQQMAQLEAMIAGVDGKHRDAVRALTTFDDVLAYDWSGGWPL